MHRSALVLAGLWRVGKEHGNRVSWYSIDDHTSLLSHLRQTRLQLIPLQSWTKDGTYTHSIHSFWSPNSFSHLSQRNRFTPSTHWTSQRPLPNMRVIWPYSWRRLANRNPQMEGRWHFDIPTPNPSRPCRWHDSSFTICQSSSLHHSNQKQQK